MTISEIGNGKPYRRGCVRWRAVIQIVASSDLSTGLRIVTALKKKSMMIWISWPAPRAKPFLMLPDAIRYTFQYDEARYTQSVQADIARIQEKGFRLNIIKNSWSSDQYKGINSQWIEPETGQRFELQFHTRISFEAKQITHSAYERLRTHRLTRSRNWYWRPSRGRSPLRYQFLPAPLTFPTIRKESSMQDKVTFYAIVDGLSSRERPAGVFRRTYFETGGRRDEAFTAISSGSPPRCLSQPSAVT